MGAVQWGFLPVRVRMPLPLHSTLYPTLWTYHAVYYVPRHAREWGTYVFCGFPMSFLCTTSCAVLPLLPLHSVLTVSTCTLRVVPPDIDPSYFELPPCVTPRTVRSFSCSTEYRTGVRPPDLLSKVTPQKSCREASRSMGTRVGALDLVS